MELFERVVSKGGKVSYVPHVPASRTPLVVELDDKQLVTLAVSVGITLLMQLEQQLPPHSRNARCIKDVANAILRLAHGCGDEVSEELMLFWWDCWAELLKNAQGKLVERFEMGVAA